MDDFDLSLNIVERQEMIGDALVECHKELNKEMKHKGKENSVNE
ncbi:MULTISPECIES: hypothetical protein [Bacillota]|nr:MULTISPECIES: hypothetical protein [Bacillota]